MKEKSLHYKSAKVLKSTGTFTDLQFRNNKSRNVKKSNISNRNNKVIGSKRVSFIEKNGGARKSKLDIFFSNYIIEKLVDLQLVFSSWKVWIIIFVIVSLIILLASIVYTQIISKAEIQFESEVQLQGDEHDLIQWDKDYNDLSSAKSVALRARVESAMQSSMQAEGIQVERVETFSLSVANPVSFVRKEQVLRVRRDIGTGIQGRISIIDKQYNDIRYVNVMFRTFALPLLNAEWFGSVTDNLQWDNITKAIENRLASAALHTKLATLVPKQSFLDSVEAIVKNDPFGVPSIAVVARKPILCDCPMTGYELSVANPSILCDCLTSCANENTHVISGGANNIFGILSPICPAAFYAGLTSSDGGYVEALYTSFQTIKAGPNKNIPGIAVAKAEIFTNTYTLKQVGFAIKPTLPPTTGNPAVGGFFGVITTTPSPFIKHNPGRNFTKKQFGSEVMRLGLFVQGGQYRPLVDRQQTNSALEASLNDLQQSVDNALRTSTLSVLTWEIDELDAHPECEDGIVAVVLVKGDIAQAVALVNDAEAVDSTVYTQTKNSLQRSNREMVFLRFSSELLNALR